MLSRYKTGYNFSPRTFYLALLTVPERHFYTYLEKRKKKNRSIVYIHAAKVETQLVVTLP